MKSALPSSLFLSTCLSGFLCAAAASAQTQLVSSDYFPAELEFSELIRVRPEKLPGGKSPTPAAPETAIFDEVGVQRFARRSYDTKDGGILNIEVASAKDERAAYSLLTLLRNAQMVSGPPGENYAARGDRLVFAKGNFWVRIQGDNPGDLLRRVAISVSNRIGPRDRMSPSLVSHFPRKGLDLSSARYFLGSRSFDSFGNKIPGLHLRFRPEMEIAQAEYSVQGRSGVLSLINFPTGQIAGEYFDSLSDSIQPEAGLLYTRRVGPIVGILHGSFDPAIADEILGAIKFSYSIKWIYDKDNRSSAIVWGVPVRILGTVVRSLLLTVLLCVMSLVLGVAIAMFRMFLRGYAPGNFLDAPERTEMIRLRLNEERLPASGTASSRDPTESQ